MSIGEISGAEMGCECLDKSGQCRNPWECACRSKGRLIWGCVMSSTSWHFWAERDTVALQIQCVIPPKAQNSCSGNSRWVRPLWKQRADIAQSVSVLSLPCPCFHLLIKVLTVEPCSYLDLIFFPHRPPEACLLYNSSCRWGAAV